MEKKRDSHFSPLLLGGGSTRRGRQKTLSRFASDFERGVLTLLSCLQVTEQQIFPVMPGPGDLSFVRCQKVQSGRRGQSAY